MQYPGAQNQFANKFANIPFGKVCKALLHTLDANNLLGSLNGVEGNLMMVAKQCLVLVLASASRSAGFGADAGAGAIGTAIATAGAGAGWC